MTDSRQTTSSYQCIFVIAILISSCSLAGSESVTAVTQFSSKLNKFIFASTDKDATKSPVTTLVWSPLSVYSALSVLLDGAGGQTEKELRDVLQPSLKNDVNFTSSLNKSSSSSDGLSIATGLFISNQFKINKAFAEKLSSRQNQPDVLGNLNITSLDFSQVEKSVAEVNNWVNKTTDGLISEIVRSDQLAKDAKLVLVNAVQFQGMWKSQFNPAKTDVGVFYGMDKNSTVDMMFQRSTQDYSRFYDEDGHACEMLKLGYTQSDTKLILILPENSSFLPTLFDHLTSRGSKLSELMERLEPTELDIYIPKFKIESEVPIKSAIQQAGVNSIFSQGECNLTGLIDATDTSSSIPLYVSDLVHKTVLNVDEEGTKAGAATGSFLVPLSDFLEHRVQSIKLNKPFIVFIRQARTSVFQGIVMNLPSKEIVSATLPAEVSEHPAPDSAFSKNESSLSNEKPKETPLENNATSDVSASKRQEHSSEPAWWVPTGNPEYLQSNIDARTQLTKPEGTLNSSVSANSSPKKSPAYRFQQPEPSNPDGLRFLLQSRYNKTNRGRH